MASEQWEIDDPETADQVSKGDAEIRRPTLDHVSLGAAEVRANAKKIPSRSGRTQPMPVLTPENAERLIREQLLQKTPEPQPEPQTAEPDTTSLQVQEAIFEVEPAIEELVASNPAPEEEALEVQVSLKLPSFNAPPSISESYTPTPDIPGTDKTAYISNSTRYAISVAVGIALGLLGTGIYAHYNKIETQDKSHGTEVTKGDRKEQDIQD